MERQILNTMSKQILIIKHRKFHSIVNKQLKF